MLGEELTRKQLIWKPFDYIFVCSKCPVVPALPGLQYFFSYSEGIWSDVVNVFYFRLQLLIFSTKDKEGCPGLLYGPMILIFLLWFVLLDDVSYFYSYVGESSTCMFHEYHDTLSAEIQEVMVYFHIRWFCSIINFA